MPVALDDDGDVHAFLRSLIEVFPLGAMVISPDYRVLLANRIAREVSGRRDPVASGLKCHEVSHFSSSPCAGEDDPCPLKQVLETRAPVALFHTHYDVAGKAHRVEVLAAPILDAQGEVAMVIEATREVTEFPSADHLALVESEARLRAMVESCPHAMAALDEGGQVVYMNAGAGDLLSLDPGRVVGEPHSSIVTDADQSCFQETIALARCHTGRRFSLSSIAMLDASGGDVMVDAAVIRPSTETGFRGFVVSYNSAHDPDRH